MIARSIIFIFFIVYLSADAFGQILPPIIDCIDSDTIRYTPVNNTCGPFTSYEVFTATDINGPFSSLGNITDPNATFFEHPNSSNIIRFYFLVPNFDCPGEAVINSDTVSNRPPLVGILQTVSVENNMNTLSWDPSPSPEVINYSVFLVTDSGLDFLADTPNTSYTDTTRDPNLTSYNYLIAANDICGNRSIFGDPIRSMLLSQTIDPCAQEITFTWNRHLNAIKQELWARTAQGNETMISTFDNLAEQFVLTNVPNTDIEGFFIRATINNNANRIANSNFVILQQDVSRFMEEILFTSVNTFDDTSAELEWCWTQGADLQNFDIVIDGNGNVNQVEVNGLQPTESNEMFTISIPNTSSTLYNFNIESLDVCDGEFVSSDIQSIRLEANPLSESELRLQWNDYNYPDALLENYQVFEIVNGVDELTYEGTANNTILTVTENGGERCFFVVANARGLLLDGTEKVVQITSNMVCSKGLPIIRMPNAFNPYGFNSIFKPLVGNTDAIQAYQLKVFSRYGELLFTTNALEEGWNGRTGLREMPQGVYTYLVEVDVVGGEEIVLKGTVLLIR